MKLSLRFRSQLSGLSDVVRNELDQLVSAIQIGWNVQHDGEGRHTNVTATELRIQSSYAETGTEGNHRNQVIGSVNGSTVLDNGATNRRGGTRFNAVSDLPAQNYRGHLVLESFRGVHLPTSPRIRYRRSIDQSIPNGFGATTAIDWNNIEFGSELSGFTLAAGVISFPEIGGYHCVLNVRWEANNAGQRIAGMSFNGTLVAWEEANATQGITTSMNLSQIIPINAPLTDALTCLVAQNSGAALNLDGAAFPNLTSLTIARLW